MLLRFVLMAVVWALGLYALHLLPIGVPVGFNVYSQAGLPWAMSSIRVLSFWGYESLFVFCGLAIAWGFLRQRRVMLACGLVVMAVPIVLGLTLPQSKNPLAGVPMITMTTLPSIEEIRRPGYDPDVWVRRFEAEFARKKQGWGLVILPEGTLPDQNTVFHGLSNEVLVAGAFIHDNGKTYNGVVIRQYRAGELRKQWLVRKRILVPFGETTPFIGDAPVQAILKPFHIDYETGLTAGLLNQPPIRVRLEAPDARLSRDVDVSVLICFEMFYPSLVGTRSADHVVLGVSNLGWFHGNAQFARIVKASWMLL